MTNEEIRNELNKLNYWEESSDSLIAFRLSYSLGTLVGCLILSYDDSRHNNLLSLGPPIYIQNDKAVRKEDFKAEYIASNREIKCILPYDELIKDLMGDLIV